jgi:hypothetical protein
LVISGATEPTGSPALSVDPTESDLDPEVRFCRGAMVPTKSAPFSSITCMHEYTDLHGSCVQFYGTSGIRGVHSFHRNIKVISYKKKKTSTIY